MQSTSLERLSQRVKPGFGRAVALVLENEQRLIEERLLSFRLTYAMLIDALARVPSVPIEADDARPIDHLRILAQYTVASRPRGLLRTVLATARVRHRNPR